MQHIPTTDTPLPFKPKSLGKGSKVVFYARPMTNADFDMLGFELFRHNIAPIAQDTFRATMIDEIFKLYGDVGGETKAVLMDEFWQGEDLYNEAAAEWRMQEQQRIFDAANGAPPRPAIPAPVRVVSVRRRTEAQLFAEEIRNTSRRMRDLTIEMQSYEPKSREGITRLVLAGWEGLKAKFSNTEGIVPDDVFQAMKKEIGKTAVAELHQFVMSLGQIDPVEVGNFASPPGSGSDLNGSPIPSEESGSSDGNSTFAEETIRSTSNTSPTPSSASVEATGLSSNSTSAAPGETGKTGSSPMGAG